MAEDIEANRQRGRVPAVVLGLGTIGLAVRRSLGQMGVQVIGVENSRLNVGYYSRYGRTINSPDPEAREEEYIAFLHGLASSLGDRPVLFPCRDQELGVVARHKSELTRSFRIPVADNDVTGKLLDKGKFYDLIRDMDIDYPATYLPQNPAQVTEISREISYPCIVKPVYTIPFSKQFSVKCFYASDAQELINAHSRAVNNGHEVIIQEVIPGDDSCLYQVNGYFDRNSEPQGVMLQHKIRSCPESYGIGSLTESWEDPELMRKGIEFMRAVRFHGVGQVEFKRDPRDGRYKVLEINARPYTQLWLVTACGINLPYMAYLDALGKPMGKVTDYKPGIKWLCMSDDLRTCLSRARSGRLKAGEYIRSLRGKKVYSVLDFADPVPFLLTPVQLGYMAINYLRKKARRKAAHPDANPGILPLRH